MRSDFVLMKILGDHHRDLTLARAIEPGSRRGNMHQVSAEEWGALYLHASDRQISLEDNQHAGIFARRGCFTHQVQSVGNNVLSRGVDPLIAAPFSWHNPRGETLRYVSDKARDQNYAQNLIPYFPRSRKRYYGV